MNQDFAAALTSIYDAATNSIHWSEALDVVRRHAELTGVTLWVEDYTEQPYQLNAYAGYDPAEITDYFEKCGHFDQHALHYIRNHGEIGEMVRDLDIWPELHEVQGRADIAMLRNSLNVRQRAGIRLNKHKGWNDVLGVQLPCVWDQAPQDFAKRVSFFVPHYAKAVELNRTFCLLRNQYKAVFAALDKLKIGLCVSNKSGEVVIANEEAQTILDENDGLTLSKSGLLTSANENVTRAISSAAERMSLTVHGNGRDYEETVICERPSGRAAFAIDICPLSDGDGEFDTNVIGCLISIIDPERTLNVKTSLLAKVFGLTSGEGKVLEHLVVGLRLEDIADIRGSSIETVRTQAKSIYRKVGVASRVDLIRRALIMSPPIF